MSDVMQYILSGFFAIMAMSQIGLLVRIYFLLGGHEKDLTGLNESLNDAKRCMRYIKGSLTKLKNRIRELERAH